MDISKFNTRKKSNEGAIFWLPDPTDPMTSEDWQKARPLVDENGNKVGIRLAGKYSDHFENCLHKRVSEQIEKEDEKESDSVSERIKKRKNATIDLIATCAIEFVNMTFNGSDCSYEVMVELLNQEPWIIAPADSFIGNHANFLEKP